MPRWSAEEDLQLEEMKSVLYPQLELEDPYPEVIGDRKLMRFLRGHNNDVNKACEMTLKFLEWRKANNINKIRNEIVYGGKNHPRFFPKADIILAQVPQIVISFDNKDNYNCPLTLEQYAFSPSNILKLITIDEYINFIIYTLEYKSLILEQMSEKNERELLAMNPAIVDSSEPYGILINMTVLRDLNGITWEHIGLQGQEIIRTVMAVATDNYPELMRKCFMINTPWLFHTIWYFISGMLSPRTLEKISVLGTDYLENILKDMSLTSLPSELGGSLCGSDIPPFNFDTSEGGLLSFTLSIPNSFLNNNNTTSEDDIDRTTGTTTMKSYDLINPYIEHINNNDESDITSSSSTSSTHSGNNSHMILFDNLNEEIYNHTYNNRNLRELILKRGSDKLRLKIKQNIIGTSNTNTNSPLPPPPLNNNNGSSTTGTTSSTKSNNSSKKNAIDNTTPSTTTTTPTTSDGSGSITSTTMISMACEYLSMLLYADKSIFDLREKRVLDLSSGTGLLSCVMCSLGADVISTEADEVQCMLTSENIAMNMSEIFASASTDGCDCGSISVKRLMWGEEISLPMLINGLDFVFAVECLIDRPSATSLLQSLGVLWNQNHHNIADNNNNNNTDEYEDAALGIVIAYYSRDSILEEWFINSLSSKIQRRPKRLHIPNHKINVFIFGGDLNIYR